MEEQNVNGNKDKNRGSAGFLPTLFIAVAVIVSSAILAYGFVYYKTSGDNDITATGSASVDFESDLIVWRGNFAQEAATSYTKAKADDTVSVRAGAGTDEDKIGTVYPGDELKVVSYGEDWSKVEYEGQEGYVKSEYFTFSE